MITFVAGPPRSGTTMLQSMICSAIGAQFLPECAAVAEIVRASVQLGHEDYRLDAFCPPDQFEDAIATVIERVLARARTEHMVLKAPSLCEVLLHIPRFFREPTKMIVVVRDPRDAIASLMRVRFRQGEPRSLVAAADFLGTFYAALADYDDGHLVRYEDVVSGSALAGLGRFLGVPVPPCKETRIDAFDATSPWYSDLYAKPITAERIGSYRDYLTRDEIGAIDESYARFYERFGYARHEDTAEISRAA